jgi:hypothetical protein
MGAPVDTPIGPVTPEHFRPGQVRHQLVVGPKFLYALFNPKDRMHAVSRAFMTFVRDGDLPYRRLVCNEHIVDEAATRLKKQASIRNASRLLTTLDESRLYTLEFVPDDAFESASQRFTEWTDLDASFTDFVVAAHMEAAGVDHIVTYDTHYEAFDVTTLPYRA